MLNREETEQYRTQLEALKASQPEAATIGLRILDVEDYCGWVNRETWALILHLQNDQSLWQQTLDKIHNRGTVAAGDALKDWIESHKAVFHHSQRPALDVKLWGCLFDDVGSLWRVDWTVVAETITED